MTSPSDIASDWSFRVFDKRLVVVKAKNQNVRKLAVLDVLTNLPFAIEVPPDIEIDQLALGKEYLANLRVYSSKNMEGVEKDFISFFEAVDINQTIEDFIKVYWIYPTKIRFQVEEIEEP